MSDLPQHFGPQVAGEMTKHAMDAVSSLSGSAAEEIKQWLGDEVRAFRFKRTLKLFESAKSKLAAVGLKINPVRAKILFPLIEAASLQDDEEPGAMALQDRWSSLLANASLNPQSIPPAFPEILRQLSVTDAQLFEYLVEVQGVDREKTFSLYELVKLFLKHPALKESELLLDIGLGNLERLALLRIVPELGTKLILGDGSRLSTLAGLGGNTASVPAIVFQYQISGYGIEFHKACQPPVKPQEKA